jgi:casein kinase I homolog HRR25
MLSDQLVSLTHLMPTFIRLAEHSVTQISRLEYIHSCHFVHRDLKPCNILIGTSECCNTISIIDFGLAKQYRDKDTYFHIPCHTNHSLVGTAAFASINNHRGLEQSRRDDLESLAYVLIYFLRGSLPWYGNAKGSKTRSLKFTQNAKADSRINLLCKSLPKEFAIFIDYTRALRYNETPDYKYLRSLFSNLLDKEGHQYDNAFDWHAVKTSPNNIVSNEEKKIGHVTKTDKLPRRV